METETDSGKLNMGQNSEIIIYQTSDNKIRIQIRSQDETVWLNRTQISELYQKERSVITKHIGNIFKEEELDQKSNVQFMHIGGLDKPVKFYNLDVIISVGYRVKSKQGTQFRQWATKRIHEYIVKGFTMDDDRLKQEGARSRYFEELLQRIINLILSSQCILILPNSRQQTAD